MIQAILKSIKPTITSMTWVDRYAGLAMPVSRTKVISTGSTTGGATGSTTDDGGYKQEGKETFPIASDVDMKRCWETGDYQDLVPNSKYKSVIYWEDLTGLQEVNRRRISGGRHLVGMQATLRMVCWLNMKKLGYESNDGTSKFQLDAMKTLMIDDIVLDNQTNIKITYAKMRVVEILKRDHQLIFGQYSYGGQSDLFVYPWDFFALNVRLNVVMSNECAERLGAKGAIEC